MKRISILLLLLAFGVAACGEQAADQTDAPAVTPSATAEATEEPTTAAEPSDEPAETDDSGDGTALAEMIPDELNGVAGTSVPGMDAIMGQALQQQGIAAEDIEFEFVSYGEGADAVVLTAFRIPGLPEGQMESLAEMMSAGLGGQQGVEAEAATIGGKSVLRMTATGGAGGGEGVIYMYFAEGAAFTIISPSADAANAEALLAELP
jgi:hypothetical protein